MIVVLIFLVFQIVRYIVETRRYGDVGGNSLWQTMAARGVVPDRTYHSLKERFRKVIESRLIICHCLIMKPNDTALTLFCPLHFFANLLFVLLIRAVSENHQ